MLPTFQGHDKFCDIFKIKKYFSNQFFISCIFHSIKFSEKWSLKDLMNVPLLAPSHKSDYIETFVPSKLTFEF